MGEFGGFEGEELGLVSAASLLDPEHDADEGDFEPGLYKGFEIVPPAEWPQVKAHLTITRRFYVRHNDMIGLVPWPGSRVIWHYESAWEQDLFRSEVETLIRPEPRKKR